MLKLIYHFLRVTTFAVVVIVGASTIEFDGKPISDQVTTRVAHARDSGPGRKAENWLTEKWNWFRDRLSEPKSETLLSTEQEKLRHLLKDLNSSR